MFKRLLLTSVLMSFIVSSFVAQMCIFDGNMRKNVVGVVYGANGPLSGVLVLAEGDNGSGYAITDASGHYSMTTGLYEGTYNLTTFTTGYIMGERDLVSVTTGQTTAGVDFDLQASGGVSGVVTDAINAVPMNGTSVYANPSNSYLPGWYGTTGSDGKYLIATNLPTGTYDVSVLPAPDGYVQNKVTVNVTAGVETKNVDIQLARSGIVSGRVSAPNGTGLYGISVSAYSSGYTYLGYAQTDLSGNYRITTGLVSENYTVEAFGAGNYSDYPTPVAVTAGQETSGIDIELTPVTAPPTPSGAIAGRVTDQLDNPIINASVFVTGSGGTRSGMTDNNGYYNISSELGDGDDYNVSVTSPGYYPTSYPTLVTVTVGETTSNIDVQMRAIPSSVFGTIAGTVTGASNPIVPEFEYSLIEMLLLMLATLVLGRLLLKKEHCKNKGNLL